MEKQKVSRNRKKKKKGKIKVAMDFQINSAKCKIMIVGKPEQVLEKETFEK
jgi:hypothetical protein